MRLLLPLLALLLTLLPMAPARAALACGELGRLEQGQVLFSVEKAGNGDRRIHFSGLIKGSPDLVYRALTQVDQYSHVLPAYFYESSLSERTGDSAVVALRFRTHFPFPDRMVVNRYSFDRSRRSMAWERISGSVLKNDGFVIVKPYRGRSLVDFHVAIDPGLPFLPGWIFEWVEGQVVPSVVGEIDRYVQALSRS